MRILSCTVDRIYHPCESVDYGFKSSNNYNDEQQRGKSIDMRCRINGGGDTLIPMSLNEPKWGEESCNVK